MVNFNELPKKILKQEIIPVKSNQLSKDIKKDIFVFQYLRNKSVEIFKQKTKEKIVLGLTLSFLPSLNIERQFSKSENEKKKIEEILNKYKKFSTQLYFYLNEVCKRPNYYFGKKQYNAISQILLHYAKIPDTVKQLPLNSEKKFIEKSIPSKYNSVLGMYYLVKKFIEEISKKDLVIISEIVKSGAKKYYQENKQYEEEWQGSLAEHNLNSIKAILIKKNSLNVATGMIISSILSDCLEKTEFVSFP